MEEPFKVLSSSPATGVVVLQVIGELDAASSERLLSEFDQCLGITELIVNLQGCKFIDSRGLSALVTCRQQIGPDATMQIIGVTGHIERIFRLAGLETLLGLATED